MNRETKILLFLLLTSLYIIGISLFRHYFYGPSSSGSSRDAPRNCFYENFTSILLAPVDGEQLRRALERRNGTSSNLQMHRRLVFLKTHKTGGSTVNGILWRNLCEQHFRGSAAEDNGTVSKDDISNCFVPPYDHPGRIWDFGRASDREYVMHNPGTKPRTNDSVGPPFDVWLQHVKRSDFLFQTVVGGLSPPSPYGLQFVSIVRRPAARFRSAWSWYKHSTRLTAGVGSMSTMNLPTFDRWCSALPRIRSTVDGLVSLTSFVETMKSHASPCLERFHKESTPTSSDDVPAVNERSSAARAELLSLLHSISGGEPRKLFKHRTGLDATAEELVGLPADDPLFRGRYEQLLLDVAKARVLLLVCDRFDESMLVLGKILGLSGMDSLVYLKQKHQHSLEHLSDSSMRDLDSLQPFDRGVYNAACTMLDLYISYFYGDHTGSNFTADLIQYKGKLAAVERECNSSHTRSSRSELLCNVLRLDNKERVQAFWKHRAMA